MGIAVLALLLAMHFRIKEYNNLWKRFSWHGGYY